MDGVLNQALHTENRRCRFFARDEHNLAERDIRFKRFPAPRREIFAV
jgi:hypothetical protein